MRNFIEFLQDKGDEAKFILDEKNWIQKAINPKHKGYCTPMTKKTCTPARKAFAKRAKAGKLQTGGQGDPYEEYMNNALGNNPVDVPWAPDQQNQRSPVNSSLASTTLGMNPIQF